MRYASADIRERPGVKDHPLIVWWLSLCGMGLDQHDEIPWCSGFPNGIAWELSLPRSRSAAARSWLTIGRPVTLDQAAAAYDIVILSRGNQPQPGADVINAPGHVGFFAGRTTPGFVEILGANQANTINVTRFDVQHVLGVRRLAE